MYRIHTTRCRICRDVNLASVSCEGNRLEKLCESLGKGKATCRVLFLAALARSKSFQAARFPNAYHRPESNQILPLPTDCKSKVAPAWPPTCNEWILV